MNALHEMQDIPDIIETSAKGWRISDGKIQTGREADGTLETREAVVGYLKRIGIHEGTLDDGSPYAKLEADFETKEGLVSVSTPLINATSGKPTYSSCISFADGLLDCAAGELIQLKVGQSAKPNRYGKHSTYANLFHVKQTDGGKWSATAVKKYPFIGEPPEYGDAMLNALVDAIRLHPAYADRPKRATAEEEVEAWDAFVEALESAGWPTMQEAKAEYLAIASKAGGTTYADWVDVPAKVWSDMADVVMSGKPMPKSIQAVADKKKANAPKEVEYDPFAED